MNMQVRRHGLRLRLSIDRFGGVHLFERRPPDRYAADFDDAGRTMLRAHDRKIDMRLRRVNLWIMLPAATAWLILPHTRYALPMPIAVVALFVFAVSIVAFNVLARCPNCRRQPHHCVDFCPACGERALVADAHKAPTCTACKAKPAYGRRGSSRRYPLHYCSTCGLRLGRRETRSAAPAP